MGHFEVYTTFTERLGQTAPSAWKCPKTQIWGPLTNGKFEPSSRALHTPTINTQNRSKNYIWISHDIQCYRSKLSITLISKDLATHGFWISVISPPQLKRVFWCMKATHGRMEVFLTEVLMCLTEVLMCLTGSDVLCHRFFDRHWWEGKCT